MSPDVRGAGPRQGSGPEIATTASVGLAALKPPELRRILEQIDIAGPVRRRAVQQVLAEASSPYWLRRAATFAAVGTSKCDEIAKACRNHGRLLSGGFGDLPPWPSFAEDFALVLAEAVS